MPNEVGKKFNPHVTIGMATEDYLKKMLDEKFESFIILAGGRHRVPISATTGPAREKLKGWDLKP